MNIEINGIKIDKDQFEAVLAVKGSIANSGYSRGIHEIEGMVARALAERIILERGPAILQEITNNQIINAVIMRVAGSISGNDR